MFKVNEYVIYGSHGVCKVVSIDKEDDKSYYVIQPLDKDLTIRIATTNDKAAIRPTLSKAEVHRLIQAMPDMKPYWERDAKKRSRQYREILNSGKCCDLISITKAIYERSLELADNQRLSLQDKDFYDKAYNRLLDEFSFALNIPREEVEHDILGSIKL